MVSAWRYVCERRAFGTSLSIILCVNLFVPGVFVIGWWQFSVWPTLGCEKKHSTRPTLSRPVQHMCGSRTSWSKTCMGLRTSTLRAHAPRTDTTPNSSCVNYLKAPQREFLPRSPRLKTVAGAKTGNRRP